VTAAGTLDPLVRYAANYGPAAPEGLYTYRMVKGKDTYEGTIEVVADPDSPHSREDRLLQQRTVMRLYDLLEDVSYVAEAMARVRDQAEELADEVEADHEGLAERLREFAAEVTRMKAGFTVSEEEIQGIDRTRRLREDLIRLYASVSQYGGRPGENQLATIPRFEEGVAEVRDRWRAFVEDELASLNKRLGARGIELLEVLSEEEYREEG
jgi:hypothetical protein